MSLTNIDRKYIDDFIEISRRIPRRGLTFGGGGGTVCGSPEPTRF